MNKTDGIIIGQTVYEQTGLGGNHPVKVLEIISKKVLKVEETFGDGSKKAYNTSLFTIEPEYSYL